MHEGREMITDPRRPVGYESRKAYARRYHRGFWDQFIKGPVVLDIGFRGGVMDAVPIVDGAIGVEQDGFHVNSFTPPAAVEMLKRNWKYDGLHISLEDGTADTVHASHILEHVNFPDMYLAEWFRVLRVGGTLILAVPHAYLYERRVTVPPSRFSPEHLRSYTPASLLTEIETSLRPNTWRLRHMEDDDTGYDYSLPIDVHPTGCLEIVGVIEKIEPPAWKVDP